jgi:hypothetical protein
MTALQWAMPRSAALMAVSVAVILAPGCDDAPSGPEDGVSVYVTGSVGVEGAWLGAIPVELGSIGEPTTSGPIWWREYDDATTSSTGAYALRARMSRSQCRGASVQASFDLPPFDLSLSLPDRPSACERPEMEVQLHFPVRRTHVTATGKILWSDGSAAGGVEVLLQMTSVYQSLDWVRTDSGGAYRVDAAVMDACCNPESAFSGHTYVAVRDSVGSVVATSAPLACGLNQMDLMIPPP